MERSYHNNKTICMDFWNEEHYQLCMENAFEFKQHLDEIYQCYPELLPVGIASGWILYGYKHPKKQDLS